MNLIIIWVKPYHLQYLGVSSTLGAFISKGLIFIKMNRFQLFFKDMNVMLKRITSSIEKFFAILSSFILMLL